MRIFGGGLALPAQNVAMGYFPWRFCRITLVAVLLPNAWLLGFPARTLRDHGRLYRKSRIPTRKSTDQVPDFVEIFRIQSQIFQDFSAFSRIVQNPSRLLLKVLNLRKFTGIFRSEVDKFRFNASLPNFLVSLCSEENRYEVSVKVYSIALQRTLKPQKRRYFLN